MIEEETKSLVTHLLMRTKNWKYCYPKVSLHKTCGIVFRHHYSFGDLRTKKKRRRICIQELYNIEPTLGLCNATWPSNGLYSDGTFHRCQDGVWGTMALWQCTASSSGVAGFLWYPRPFNKEWHRREPMLQAIYKEAPDCKISFCLRFQSMD